MRVLAIHFHSMGDLPGACEIYRANQPLYYLGTKGGWQTQWMRFESIAKELARGGTAAWVELANSADLFVLPRVVAPKEENLGTMAAFITLLRSAGKRVVYEVDDDYTNRYRDLTEMGVNHAMRIASWCDAITVTTPYLKDLMQRETKRPVYVLPNCIDPRVWDKPENRLPHEGIVIGLSGSATHYDDWKVLASPLRQILATDYGFPVRLRLTAFHPDYLLDLPNTDYLPGLDYAGYAEVVRSCDLILAPVDPEDGFNQSKSPIKVVEGMGAARPVGIIPKAGAACIATDTPVYRLAITHEKDGLLTKHTPDAWCEAIDRLLRDRALRERLQGAAYKTAWRRFDMSLEWQQWARAYRSILAKPMHSVNLREVITHARSSTA